MSIPPDRPTAQSPPKPDQIPPRHLRTPPDSTPWWRRTWAIAAATFVVGAGIAGTTVRALDTAQSPPACNAPNTSTCAREGSSARVASGDGYGFSDGEYLVGEDILPGKYHTDAGGTCYYTRLMNLSDDPSAIVVKKRVNTATIMEVEPTDYALLVSGGCIWEPMGVPIEHAS